MIAFTNEADRDFFIKVLPLVQVGAGPAGKVAAVLNELQRYADMVDSALIVSAEDLATFTESGGDDHVE